MTTRPTEARTRTLAVLGLPIIFIGGGLLAYELGGIALTLILLGALTALAAFVAWVFRPRWWGSTRVQAISILVFGGLVMAAFAYNVWVPWLGEIYQGQRGAFPSLPQLPVPDPLPYWYRLVALAITGLTFVLINRRARARYVLPPPDSAAKGPFPQKHYETLRDDFCAYMLRQLDQYETDLNWSDSDYSTLEAEVEADRRGTRRPRVERDLIHAIRRDRQTRAFLLLGDPGSGKSVSLRRLCRRLFDEVPETGIVPVYLNLRDWRGTPEPSDEDIQAFIKEDLRQRAGRAGKRFLDQWFEPMLEYGCFFFLLDSFDEMPSVLDCDDADDRIKSISRAFDRFFHDLHGCRGVLASRPFRQPRGFRGRRLSIRPFTESQVRAAMRRWLQGQPLDPDALVRDLIKERPELAPALRNPFLADLIAHYLIRHHDDPLPPSQYAIYQDYLEGRLEEDAAELRALNLTQEQILDAATRIAAAIYQDPVPDTSLETDKRALAGLVDIDRLDDVLDALRTARIIRLGGVRARRLAFVHRRFAEFFVVRAMLAADEPLPIASIPKDSRWRDCLAVYCGVAPRERIQPIADFCWEVIKAEHHTLIESQDPVSARRVVHCLRFLRDGFQSRQACLDGFRAPLGEVVETCLTSPAPLAAKFASEMLGLVDAARCSAGLTAALFYWGSWIRESALRAVQHRSDLKPEALASIRNYVRTMPTWRLLRQYDDFVFAFSISDSMKGQARALRLDLWSLGVLWLFGPLCLVSLFAIAEPTSIPLASIALISLLAFLLETFIYWGNSSTPAFFFRRGADTSIRLIALFSGLFLFVLILGGEIALESTMIAAIIASATFVVVMPWEGWTQARMLPSATRSVVALFMQQTLGYWGWVRETGLSTLLQVIGLGLLLLAQRLISHLRENARSLAIKSSVLLGYSALVWMAYRWLEIPHYAGPLEEWPIEAQLQAQGFTLLALLPLGLLSLFSGPLALYSHDMQLLKRLRLPNPITRQWVFDVCRQLKLGRNCQHFLEDLRLRAVEVEGQSEPLPDEDWADNHVREQFARLEAMWAKIDE
jgi:hypothetical protein